MSTSSAEKQHLSAISRATAMLPLLKNMNLNELSLREIALEFDRLLPRDDGKRWHSQSVARILDRITEQPVWHAAEIKMYQGDANAILKQLPKKHFQCCVTSPPYFGLKIYGSKGEIGSQATIEAYVNRVVHVFRDVKRVLRDDGTVFLVIGDTYSHAGNDDNESNFRLTKNDSRQFAVITPRRLAGFKRKNMLMIPSRLAVALQDDGWFLRSEIIWYKPNALGHAARDRPQTSHETIFLLSKSPGYYYSEIGGDFRTVWTIAKSNLKEGHPAAFPVELAVRCLTSGARDDDHVLDPFAGSGTVGIASNQLGMKATLIDLVPEFVDLANKRLLEAMRSHR